MAIEKYRELIKPIVEKHSRCDCEELEVETQSAFDIERDRYLMFHVGLQFSKIRQQFLPQLPQGHHYPRGDPEFPQLL